MHRSRSLSTLQALLISSSAPPSSHPYLGHGDPRGELSSANPGELLHSNNKSGHAECSLTVLPQIKTPNNPRKTKHTHTRNTTLTPPHPCFPRVRVATPLPPGRTRNLPYCRTKPRNASPSPAPPLSSVIHPSGWGEICSVLCCWAIRASSPGLGSRGG